MSPRFRPYDLVKRIADVFIAGAALLVSLPIQLVIALAVRVNLGSPVLFRQPRPGLGGARLHAAQVPHHARARSGAGW